MKRDTGSTEADYAEWLNDNDNIPARPVEDDDDAYSEYADKYADDDEEDDDEPSH